MQPLRAFCIASTISLSFLRRKGATIILSSLHQSNVQQPPFQNLECWCLLIAFVLFWKKRVFWSFKQVFVVCVVFFFLHNCSIITCHFSDVYLYMCGVQILCDLFIQCTFSTDMRDWLAKCIFPILWCNFHCIFYQVMLYIYI